MSRETTIPGLRPGIGRADLLYTLHRSGRTALIESADTFGYQAPEAKDKETAKGNTTSSGKGKGQSDQPDKEEKKKKKKKNQQRFFRLHQRSKILDEERVTRPPQRLLQASPFLDSIGRELPEIEQLPPMTAPPLSPWRRMWPFLRAVLGAGNYSHQLDMDRIVQGMARGEIFRHLPRLPRAGWAVRAQLLVDLDPRIHFFWNDFYDLIEQLQGLRGNAGLEIICFEDGPLRPYTGYGSSQHFFSPRPYRPPEPDVPVLILSDLGLPDNREADWFTLGRRFKKAGIRPVALMPCPERCWNREL